MQARKLPRREFDNLSEWHQGFGNVSQVVDDHLYARTTSLVDVTQSYVHPLIPPERSVKPPRLSIMESLIGACLGLHLVQLLSL